MGISKGKWQEQLKAAEASGMSLGGVRRAARHQGAQSVRRTMLAVESEGGAGARALACGGARQRTG